MTGRVRTFGHGTDRVRAVDGVDLRIEIVGPNDAGKTTALDMLLGLSEPDAGAARFLGFPPGRATAAGRIAAVLQTGGLLADLTVRETVTAIAGLHGKLGSVDGVLELTDLTGIAKRRVSKCSGGEQQCVKFALAEESLFDGANPLSERERQVLRLAADGRSAASIAAEVFLSAGTVRNHLSSAIGKTGADNRAHAARIARDKGWI